MSNDFKSVPECVPGLRESPRRHRCIILTFRKFLENRVLGLKNVFFAVSSILQAEYRVFRPEKKINFPNLTMIRRSNAFISELRDGICEDLSTRFLIKGLDLKIDTFL